MLGQSFGGFTSMTYLSIAPEGLREAFITGGLAPIGRPVDDIYGATYRRLIKANKRYFERYPDDRARVGEILRRLDDEDVRLPSGDRLTARRFRQLGMGLGDSAGFEQLHHVLELPFGSLAFLHDAEDGGGWSRNPIYATLHESSYADGVADPLVGRAAAARRGRDEGYFTAEHVFPWMWDEFAALRPQKAAAEILAAHPGRRSTTPTSSGATRSRSRRRSTSTICTSSATSPRRRRRRSAGCVRGSPTSSSTTACAPTASACSAG